MPDASPYLEAAYAVFVVLLVSYVAIIAVRMRRTARERRALEEELARRAAATPGAISDPHRVEEMV